VLKSDCRTEAPKLRAADRLANLTAVFCILSWRMLGLTMSGRPGASASPRIAFTIAEKDLLHRLISHAGNRRGRAAALRFYLVTLARLEGCLARSVGIVVLWRDHSRLTDVELGAERAYLRENESR
jgi:hypothetical protein